MEPVSLLAVLGVLLGGGFLKVIEEVMYSRKERATPEPLRNVILPSSITKTEDFIWFETVMEMAGFEGGGWVTNTCDCGFAAECHMHCNHDLNDGKCTGHAYVPWTGKFEPVKRSASEIVETEHRKRTLTDTEINAFKQKMIDKRNAKMKAEFEATKKVRGTPFEEMNALRHRMDDRQREISELKRQLKEISVSLPKPQYITQPTTYDPVLDCYTVYGKKITRQMMEDLYYNGGITREQLKEIVAPEYETVYGDDGMCYPVRVR